MDATPGGHVLITRSTLEAVDTERCQTQFFTDTAPFPTQR